MRNSGTGEPVPPVTFLEPDLPAEDDDMVVPADDWEESWVPAWVNAAKDDPGAPDAGEVNAAKDDAGEDAPDPAGVVVGTPVGEVPAAAAVAPSPEPPPPPPVVVPVAARPRVTVRPAPRPRHRARNLVVLAVLLVGGIAGASVLAMRTHGSTPAAQVNHAPTVVSPSDAAARTRPAESSPTLPGAASPSPTTDPPPPASVAGTPASPTSAARETRRAPTRRTSSTSTTGKSAGSRAPAPVSADTAAAASATTAAPPSDAFGIGDPADIYMPGPADLDPPATTPSDGSTPGATPTDGGTPGATPTDGGTPGATPTDGGTPPTSGGPATLTSAAPTTAPTI